MPEKISTPAGRVYLVGAGPGDPGLITLRGVELLSRAGVVLYDYLVNPLLLGHAPADAELICLGRHGTDRIMLQEEVNRRLIELAQQGKAVVRLKAGDPAVFAREAEEVQSLCDAGIPFEVVPGVTAALAAGSHAGIPVTHRDVASAVALVTGQESGDTASKLDYAALAAFPGTLVFYMGVTTAARWSGALIAAGRAAETPAAIIRRCSWTDQETIRCTLGSVADELKRRGMWLPVIVIVGEVCRMQPTVEWFAERPLFGQTILVTRPRRQAAALVGRLSELGAGCLVQPAIEVLPPPDWQPVDDAITRIDNFDWLVFSSANGVRGFLDRLVDRHGDLRRLGTIRLAVIGPRTADELAGYHLKPDLCPPQYRAESLAAELADAAEGKRFLLARASRGREVLAEQLSAAGGEVEQIVVYESRDVACPQQEIADTIHSGKIDWVTVTSSAIARSLVAMFGQQLRQMRLASISPVTSETLRELGFSTAAEAKEYTTAGLVDALLEAVQKV